MMMIIYWHNDDDDYDDDEMWHRRCMGVAPTDNYYNCDDYDDYGAQFYSPALISYSVDEEICNGFVCSFFFTVCYNYLG